MRLLRALVLVTAVALLVTGGVLAVVPAGSADPTATAVREIEVVYRCQSEGVVARTTVTISADLPRRVRRGEFVAGPRVRVRVVLSRRMTDHLAALGVRAVEATSDNAYYRVGAHQKPIRNLHVPRTPVPREGPLVLHGVGRAVGHTFQVPGRIPIFVPQGLTADVRAHGSLLTRGFTLGCEMPHRKPVRFGTVRVVSAGRQGA